MKYKIVEHERSSVLQRSVNALMAEGWEPLGGVTINGFAEFTLRDGDTIDNSRTVTYAQAMILAEKGDVFLTEDKLNPPAE